MWCCRNDQACNLALKPRKRARELVGSAREQGKKDNDTRKNSLPERRVPHMVAVTCDNCGTDISKDIFTACSQLAELDKKFGTSIQSDCIAKVLLADFLNSHSAKNKKHGLLYRTCSPVGTGEKPRQNKVIPLDAIREERDG